MRRTFVGCALFIASVVSNTPIYAQTAKEWVEQVANNVPEATKNLEAAYSIALARTVSHYRSKGNNERADIVERLKPNVSEITGRLTLARSTNPSADVIDVVRGYLIDASSKESSATNHTEKK